jgi:uncharacterized protein (DUF1697 family)
MASVVFLKGINVGGHRRFRPSVLAAQLEHLDAVSIGAAGTLVVRQRVAQAELRAAVDRNLPFDVDIAICTAQEIARLVSRDPFAREPARAGIVRFVSVLARRPRDMPALPVALPSEGDWLLRVLGSEGRFVFGVHRRHMKVIGLLRSLDRLFGVPVTTRNWTTIAAIVKVLEVRGIRRPSPPDR